MRLCGWFDNGSMYTATAGGPCTAPHIVFTYKKNKATH